METFTGIKPGFSLPKLNISDALNALALVVIIGKIEVSEFSQVFGIVYLCPSLDRVQILLKTLHQGYEVYS